MMKKLLVFALVLGFASMAMAVPVFRVDPQDVRHDFAPSDLVVIQLYDEGLVDAFSIDAIADIDTGTGMIAGGTGNEPRTMPAYGYQQWGELNFDGKLVAYAAGGITGTTEPPQSGVIYSFVYHVPDALPSTIIAIGSFSDGASYFDPTIMYRDGSAFNEPIPGALIHVIPEPATIALLGLGGLLLRRRK
jgi:hypothetical protein